VTASLTGGRLADEPQFRLEPDAGNGGTIKAAGRGRAGEKAGDNTAKAALRA